MAWVYGRTKRFDLCLAEGEEYEESQGGGDSGSTDVERKS